MNTCTHDEARASGTPFCGRCGANLTVSAPPAGPAGLPSPASPDAVGYYGKWPSQTTGWAPNQNPAGNPVPNMVFQGPYRLPGQVPRYAPNIGPVLDTSRRDAKWAHLGPLVATVAVAVCSLGSLGLFLWVVPLVILNHQGRHSPFVRAHAVESLNFQLTQLMYGLIGAVIAAMLAFVAAFSDSSGAFVGILVVGGLFAVAWWIWMIVQMWKASAGAAAGWTHRYPITVRFVH